jgi:hypothetical protein
LKASRTYILTAIITFLVLLIVEFMAYVFYVSQNSSYNFNKYEMQIEKATGQSGKNDLSLVDLELALHPYLGYTMNPEFSGINKSKPGGMNTSDYGFLDNFSPIHNREPNEILIGITGGSVAAWFFIETREVLESYLRKSPKFKDKKITFINMALGGWKQPQQLLSLTYLLSLGANFDMIINIDGFNDLVMPIYFNLKKSVFPYYPTNWYVFSSMPNPGFVDPLITEVNSMANERKLIADFMKNSFLSENILARVIWLNYDRYREYQANKLRDKYNYQTSLQTTWITTGTKYEPAKDEKSEYKAMASYWARSSEQMRFLADSNNIKYYHFLQPNQYVPGSKPLTEEELLKAFGEKSQYKVIVEDGYSALQQEGVRLKQMGENFYDLSYIFKDNHETLYLDECCHFNRTGLGIMAERIGDVLIDSY